MKTILHTVAAQRLEASNYQAWSILDPSEGKDVRIAEWHAKYDKEETAHAAFERTVKQLLKEGQIYLLRAWHSEPKNAVRNLFSVGEPAQSTTKEESEEMESTVEWLRGQLESQQKKIAALEAENRKLEIQRMEERNAFQLELLRAEMKAKDSDGLTPVLQGIAAAIGPMLAGSIQPQQPAPAPAAGIAGARITSDAVEGEPVEVDVPGLPEEKVEALGAAVNELMEKLGADQAVSALQKVAKMDAKVLSGFINMIP